MDARDPLAAYRSQFVIDDPSLIYLDGNSLGRLPRRSIERASQVVAQEWGQRLIRGWGDGWFTAPQRIGAKIAQLIGAQPDEVIMADSTSVNFFKLVMAALAARPDRSTVVTDELNFPSDLYLLQGALRLAGPDRRLVRIHSADGLTVPLEALQEAITADTALVTLTHTTFKSGYIYDMPAVTELAHATGALML